MNSSVLRVFIVFHVLAGIYALLFTMNPVVVLVLSSFLGLITVRLLVACWYGKFSAIKSEWAVDFKHGWIFWGPLVALAIYCSQVYPNSLVMSPLSLEVGDAFFIKSSVFKPISIVLMVGLLQLELLSPRSMLASYWKEYQAQSLGFTEWIREWNKTHPSECIQGLCYVGLIYTVSIFCPILTFAAFLLLMHSYTGSSELTSKARNALLSK